MNKVFLFDFDGVIVHTEPEYDKFFDALTERMHLDVPHFAERLKGKRLADTLKQEFPQFTAEQKQQIIDATHEFEMTMNLPWVAGVREFLARAKSAGYRLGLVTSSIKPKMTVALQKLGLAEGMFDVMVMAERIERGKPDPQCYLLAAEELNVSPTECIVFEDSLAGVQAGLSADMTVVGVATTLPAEQLRLLTPQVINDFTDIEIGTITD